MRRYIIILLLFILVFSIQTAMLPFFSIYNISPDLLLIAITALSILNGQWEGMIFGLVTGILMDMFYSPVFGIYSIIYATFGFSVGKLSKNIFKESPFAALFFTITGSIYKGVVILFFKILLAYKTDVWMTFLALIFPEAVLNGIIIFLLYGYILRLNDSSYLRKNKTMF
ncbi:rod shape-determining protein MreD [Calorimonas adulescens]|uniref:Rod shape-determining protein MreD n=1 Tax=Calorimonas adulescens TaxID=2606906 RepID=A0A5D8QEH3_9THEO|nr:rod shape-determining protein MreD [Calorimonas adulescens]TZE82246.1 rod shape-determining protein MreD [Calorimonas adulescens]